MIEVEAFQAQAVVSFVTLILSHYRLPFHSRVRELLSQAGIDYRLIYSGPVGSAATKNDTGDLDWAIKVPVHRFRLLGKEAYWQDARQLIAQSDLTIVSQENKLLLNYYLMGRAAMDGRRLAYFGHGRNHQSKNPAGLGERFKRGLATRVHWWFAYTSGVADLLTGYGFPRERITVNCNAIDTTSLRRELDSIGAEEIAALKAAHDIRSDNVAVFIGGMYEEKRVPFLIEAARLVRAMIPDFELVLIGSGPQAELAREAAEQLDFVHYLGPVFDRQKAAWLKMSKAFLMPGLVGLAVLDSFAAGTPIITTDVDYHSPEIEYLENGRNGIIVGEADSSAAYAASVARVMTDCALHERLSREAHRSAEHYTIERMAENFANGVITAVRA